MVGAVIGNRTGGSLAGHYFNGKIANIGLWSRALTPEEVQSIMNKSYSQLKGVEKTSLVMWQSLDSTGFGSDLTLGKFHLKMEMVGHFGSPVTLGYSTTNVYLGSQSLHITNAE